MTDKKIKVLSLFDGMILTYERNGIEKRGYKCNQIKG